MSPALHGSLEIFGFDFELSDVIQLTISYMELPHGKHTWYIHVVILYVY
jgi:hypothetical protein